MTATVHWDYHQSAEDIGGESPSSLIESENTWLKIDRAVHESEVVWSVESINWTP